MAMEDIVKWVGGGIVAIATLVQITPIKINPWSFMLKALGNALIGDSIDKLDKRMDGMERAIEAQKDAFNERNAYDDEQRAKDKRYRILKFGDECSHGTKHSEEMFNQIMEDISEYLDYCDSHKGFKNKKAEVTINIIVETYKKCKQENNFL